MLNATRFAAQIMEPDPPAIPGPDDAVLRTTEHRPSPLPGRPWAMQQRWNDLLFAHWPMPVSAIDRTLPQGLVADTFDGSAWLGIVPFAMDRIHLHGLPPVPGARAFPELNLRTYVRERGSNRAGVYFYSLDASNPLAVAIARTVFHLPYYWATMGLQYGTEQGRSREIRYRSHRLFAANGARFRATYRGLGTIAQGPLENFLTARYALYTSRRDGTLLRGEIHHLPWPLERAEAEFAVNELPAAHGFTLPDCAPVLHYSRELLVYVWTLDRVGLVRPSLSRIVQAQPQTTPVGSPVAAVKHN
jgi:uncharacterized protein YqjF (DUF2071 family)